MDYLYHHKHAYKENKKNNNCNQKRNQLSTQLNAPAIDLGALIALSNLTKITLDGMSLKEKN